MWLRAPPASESAWDFCSAADSRLPLQGLARGAASLARRRSAVLQTLLSPFFSLGFTPSALGVLVTSAGCRQALPSPGVRLQTCLSARGIASSLRTRITDRGRSAPAVLSTAIQYWHMGSGILIFPEDSLLSRGGLQSLQLPVLLDSNNFFTPKGPWVYRKHRKWNPDILPFSSSFSIYSCSQGASGRGAASLHQGSALISLCSVCLQPSCSHCLGRWQMLPRGAGARWPHGSGAWAIPLSQFWLCSGWRWELFSCPADQPLLSLSPSQPWTKEPLDKGETGEWTSWLKTQHSKN